MSRSLAKMFERGRAASAALSSGLRIYAVGDIHGRMDLLDELASLIQADLVDAPKETLTIFLGDYIDRGPGSYGILERLSTGDFPTAFLALRGNHEEMALKFLEDESVLEGWRKFGGLETLHSYGVDVGDAMRGKGFGAAREKFVERLPHRHRAFLEETPLSASYGDYFFCHAGVRPGVSFERQTAEDLLWIRDDFLKFAGAHQKFVVHGHSPVHVPDAKSNRINLDTGAFATSLLTALVLENADRRFLFAGNLRATSADFRFPTHRQDAARARAS